MAPPSKTLTEYEQQRLDNIRRNKEMVASLLLRSKASDLNRVIKPKLKPKPRPKPDPKPDTAPRRSGRTRRATSSTETPIGSALRGFIGSDSEFLDSIRSVKDNGPGLGKKEGLGFDPREEMVLEDEGRIGYERITTVGFLPVEDRTVVIAGNIMGNLGFWDVEAEDFFYYILHSDAVSGISVHPFAVRKIFTSSHDGFVRVMDIEKGVFSSLCFIDHPFYSICQRPYDAHSVYIGDGAGRVNVWDAREGKSSGGWDLHVDRINTIDFSPQDTNLMATSANDGTARVWDIRTRRLDRPRSLKSIRHDTTVVSAYFSPTGTRLATSCSGDEIGVLSGANFEKMSMIPHRNISSVLSVPFRAIWGWDDSYLFIGSNEKVVDVISTVDATTTALQTSDLRSVLRPFAAHPYKPGSLVGAAAGGKVFLWSKN